MICMQVSCAAESAAAGDGRRGGEVSLACAAADVSSSEWLWVTGPTAAEVVAANVAAAEGSSLRDKGVDVVAELSR